ncbi:MAG TPA: hypothetical protein PLQ56_02985 [Aggregatilineales bacterium]|nr:hypothetical protein [Aggregatilineales bacterium]
MSSIIWSGGEIYNLVEYADERDLEKAILEVRSELFGLSRIYLDVKKKIGQKGSQRNIPDGYLVDLSGSKPLLFVVENELAVHDPLRHVAVQILQFSLSFESEPRTVRTIVFDAINSDSVVKSQCEDYVRRNHFRNLDHLIDVMVFESPFAALVIIDSIPDKLEKILAEKFRFGVEVLSLARYENASGKRLYFFEPFLSDIPIPVRDTGSQSNGRVETIEIDTVVVPAHAEGFQRAFLGENNWHAIRIHGTVRPQIKYIAAYQIRPISAITHVAPVRAIEPYGDEGKYIVYFAEPAKEITPVPMLKNGKIKTFQNLRYTTLDRLMSASNLDEVFLNDRMS